MFVRELSPGERLLIHRRRLGRTQQVMSNVLGISLSTYRRIEYDIDTPSTGTPTVVLRKLSTQEISLVRRRRCGLTQEQLGARVGRSRWWVNMAENGQIPGSLLNKLL